MLVLSVGRLTYLRERTTCRDVPLGMHGRIRPTAERSGRIHARRTLRSWTGRCSTSTSTRSCASTSARSDPCSLGSPNGRRTLHPGGHRFDRRHDASPTRDAPIARPSTRASPTSPASTWARDGQVVDDFYGNVFPTLGAGIGPKPGAREAVEAARQAGMLVAIATNPIFPAAADTRSAFDGPACTTYRSHS